MNFFSSMNASSSGMSVEQMRMEAASQNIASANVSRKADGSGGRLWQVSIREASANSGLVSELPNGVQGTTEAVTAKTRLEYDPEHPDANAAGYVAYNDVSFVDQMLTIMDASRTYEANVTAYVEGRNMLQKSLEIGRA